MLEEYYPSTQIDTEIIVRTVADDVRRNQNYVLFRLLRLREDKKRDVDSTVPAWPPRVIPMLYQAQSTQDVHFLVRIQETFEDLDCSVTYEQKVDIAQDQVFVSAVCYESETDVHLYERTI